MSTIIFTTPPCPVCHKSSEVELDGDKLRAWKGGTNIQHVWPEKTPDERELLMTGSHPECWEEMFPRDPWFVIEGQVVGFYSQVDNDDGSMLLVKVEKWKQDGEADWRQGHFDLPVFLLRWANNDLEVVGRGSGYTEESSPGLGDTIRFTTNREEQDGYAMIEINREARNILAIRERGYADGVAAASWLVDGNTPDPRSTLERLINGIEDGDPEIIDQLPLPRLGGEWADDPTWADVLKEETGIEDDSRDDLYEEYTTHFSQGVDAEIHRMLGAYSNEAGAEISEENEHGGTA